MTKGMNFANYMNEIRIEIQTNLDDQNLRNAVADQRAKYEYEKQKELDDLKNKQQLEIAEQQKQKTRLGLFAAAIIALLIGVFSVYTFNRLKLIRSQKAKLDEAQQKAAKFPSVLEYAQKPLNETIIRGLIERSAQKLNQKTSS